MSFSQIGRELRKKKWKSSRNWRRAYAKKQRLLKKLGKLERQLDPDQKYGHDGILVHIHEFRGYSGRVEYGFRFFRNGKRGEDDLFGLTDLETLAQCSRRAFQTIVNKEAKKLSGS